MRFESEKNLSNMQNRDNPETTDLVLIASDKEVKHGRPDQLVGETRIGLFEQERYLNNPENPLGKVWRCIVKLCFVWFGWVLLGLVGKF